jgi:hypothetical protein
LLNLTLLSGLACAPVVPATRYGSIVLDSRAARVIARGPATLHAYAQARGGLLYVAPAGSGTDRDCAGQDPMEARSRLAWVRAEKRLEVRLAVGEVACVQTSHHGFELLWHVHQNDPDTRVLALASGGAR